MVKLTVLYLWKKLLCSKWGKQIRGPKINFYLIFRWIFSLDFPEILQFYLVAGIDEWIKKTGLIFKEISYAQNEINGWSVRIIIFVIIYRYHYFYLFAISTSSSYCQIYILRKQVKTHDQESILAFKHISQYLGCSKYLVFNNSAIFNVVSSFSYHSFSFFVMLLSTPTIFLICLSKSCYFSFFLFLFPYPSIIW